MARDFLEIEPGKLIVVGEFNAIGDQPAGAITAIDTAGNVLWDLFTGTDAGELVISSANSVQRALYGIEQAPDGFIYIFGSYSGFDDGCSNHPNQRLITRLYPLHVGVDELASADVMSVTPNPSNGRFALNYQGQPEAGQLEVRDPLGRIVLHDRLSPLSTEHQVVLENVGAGLYICRVNWGGRIAIAQIVVGL